MQPISVSRRAFAGAAVASSLARVKGANERISLGLIGVGSRGQYDLTEIIRCKGSNAAVTAVCDVYRPNRERAAAVAAKAFGAKPRETDDYRELLAWREVDAVVVATPDSGHSKILEDAVKAGKDVYCEKPMGVDFAEAKSAFLAVKQSRQVVQIGTQRRSEGQYIAAAKLMRSGILGQVTRVDIAAHFHEPRWRRDFHGVQESDVAWDRYLFNRPRRPFDARRLREWQLFRDYTNGIAGLWLCHFSDLAHWFLDETYPAGAVASGGVYLWKDGRETADVFHCLLDYPKGILFSFAMSLTNAAGSRNLWHGTRGTLDLDKWTISGDGAKGPDRLEQTIRIAPEAGDSHMRNFLDCLRSRQTPRCDIQAGFSHAVAGCMTSTAFDAGRKVRFDPVKLEMI
ncbi:MAG: Gfo/Idh/MocA family oxidoreductase [Acidobacteria bacterium]|nr:Gfo/Idh/MocA family oxidoreductase [Acidobacteriota bacterium]